MDYKKFTVVFTDSDYSEKTKSYLKKGVKTNFYDMWDLELKIYPKIDEKKVWTISFGWNSYTIRENDWEYGTYRSATIQKQELYANVKKGLARIWKSAPIEVTFREADEGVKSDEGSVKDIDWSEDEDVPF